MIWLNRYRIRHYIENSVWVFPICSIVAALILVRVLHSIDRAMDWELPVARDTAIALMGAMASAMFTLVVFVSSALLVAVQLASAQLTPRIIALVFGNVAMRVSLTLFVFTFTFALGALIRIGDTIPRMTGYVASYGCVISLAVFLVLIDRVGKALRPSGALRAVATYGRAIIKHVYPHQLLADAPPVAPAAVGDKPTMTIESRKDGAVLAFDVKGLATMAEEADCVIELVPQVGDHVATGDPLFRVYGPCQGLTDRELRSMVAIGLERTLEQDPTFAFRIMVDIANKGLSPAINDPTTAVLALDQIHHLLRYVGTRKLDNGNVLDSSGGLRLFFRTPDWEDFVHLAVTEIRHFGGSSIQVARRLRAMLENLIQNLPECRRPLLQQELAILHRSAERFFTEPEDRAMAKISDAQGVGGKSQSQ